MRLAFAILACLLVAGCASGSDEPAPSSTREAPRTTAPPTTAPEEAAPATPVEQLAGKLVMTKLAGPTASAEELAMLRQGVIGGVILFGPNVVDAAQLEALTTSVQQAQPGALVSVDQEGGTIRNVPFAPPERTQPELANGGVDAARAAAHATGEALAALGISMDLGPVADLAQQPNRTMAGRAFGEDARSVAPFVAATVEGLQQGGVAAAAKHFPGFGASSENSDNGVARVERSRSQLDAEELVPFRAAIDAGAAVVMVSHGIYGQLGASMPAVLERRIVTGILRDELGFEGVAMTDSMNAKGFRDAWGDTVPRACPRAVAAGIDLVLLTGSLETARLCRARIVDAVRDGTLDEARVREAADRVQGLRASWPRSGGRAVPTS
jgi:beta-N-acetylhexosaminidase